MTELYYHLGEHRYNDRRNLFERNERSWAAVTVTENNLPNISLHFKFLHLQNFKPNFRRFCGCPSARCVHTYLSIATPAWFLEVTAVPRQHPPKASCHPLALRLAIEISVKTTGKVTISFFNSTDFLRIFQRKRFETLAPPPL